ncbi:hypothetical protein KIN20_005160 [Parelaphostrongylus tenuis]|uniref:Uncharacterized protein n=1 Tax=Parelaphostrongylus tenuis TaxID=148309 RepID=A0AAD5QH97_PARTN|nr:hypothetical protein KIN20_005160 [Parelaphostrongylus tenuis]
MSDVIDEMKNGVHRLLWNMTITKEESLNTELFQFTDLDKVRSEKQLAECSDIGKTLPSNKVHQTSKQGFKNNREKDNVQINNKWQLRLINYMNSGNN